MTLNFLEFNIFQLGCYICILSNLSLWGIALHS